MHRRVFVLLAAALSGLAPGAAEARREVAAPSILQQAAPYELVVFEADNCVYCQNFREDVLPLYRESKIGREIPIRFVNVSRSDETGMGLSHAITIAPTVVLMHQGREVDRIIGYTGPFNFLKLVNYMLGRSEWGPPDGVPNLLHK